jgi:poly(hydroxyalkanoate) granule-associated protein
MWQHILGFGLLIGGLCLAVQAWALTTGTRTGRRWCSPCSPWRRWRMCMAIRSETDSLWRLGLGSNKPVLGAVGLTFALQMAVIYVAARAPAVKAPAAKTAVAKAKKTVAAKAPTLKQVAHTGTRKVSSVVHMTRDASFKLIDSQRSIWLAGLGALAKVTTSTGVKGEKAFESLVKAGEKFEAQARGAIDSNADLLKGRISDATKVVDQGIGTVGDAFDSRIKQALTRLGYGKKTVK